MIIFYDLLTKELADIASKMRIVYLDGRLLINFIFSKIGKLCWRVLPSGS